MARPRVAERLLISVSRWQFRLLKPFETQKWKSLMGKKSDWKVHFSDSPGEIKSAISSGRKAPGTPTLWQSNRDNGRKGKGLPVQFDWLGIHRRITQQYVGKGLTRLSLFLWLRKKSELKNHAIITWLRKPAPCFTSIFGTEILNQWLSCHDFPLLSRDPAIRSLTPSGRERKTATIRRLGPSFEHVFFKGYHPRSIRRVGDRPVCGVSRRLCVGTFA